MSPLLFIEDNRHVSSISRMLFIQRSEAKHDGMGKRTVLEDPIHFTGAATTANQYFLLFIFVLCILFCAHTYIGIGAG